MGAQGNQIITGESHNLIKYSKVGINQWNGAFIKLLYTVEQKPFQLPLAVNACRIYRTLAANRVCDVSQ